jgi:hypothetical protein
LSDARHPIHSLKIGNKTMETSTSNLPTAAKVFGILNCVFGGFSLAVSPFSFLSLGQAREIYEKIGLNDLTINWMIVTLCLAPILAAVLLACGIGLLLKKPIARKGSIWYGLVVIGLNGLTLLVLGAGVIGAMDAVSGDSAATAGLIGGVIGGIIGGFLGCIYPGLLAFFMSRPNIRDFFARYQ